MKNLVRLFAISIGALALLSGTARAQTPQNGPYYAMPSWDQDIPAATRFVILANFNNEAVLDRATGLVWARAPVEVPGPIVTLVALVDWKTALIDCHKLSRGNHFGWRLPTVEELLTLTPLPAGNPFNAASGGWTATTFEGDATQAYSVDAFAANIFVFPKTSTDVAWCVRGGAGAINPTN
jgi:hypothetical protein